MVAACSAPTPSGSGPAASESAAPATVTIPEDLLPGATITGEMDIPNDGPVAFGLGSVWAIDRADGEMENSVPAATLFRIDPELKAAPEEIPHVLGGSIAIAEDAIWVGSFLTDRLLRVDPGDYSITMIDTGPSGDEGPSYVTSTPGAIWVANHHGGTLARIDPETSELMDTIPVVAAGDGGPQAMTTDGSSIWVAVPREGTIFQVDLGSGELVQTTSVDGQACGGLALDDAHTLWVTNADCEGSNLVFRVDPETNGIVAIFDVQATAVDVEVGLGSVWIVTADPARLIRIDGETNQVTGRLDLRANPVGAADSLAVGDDALWVRVLNGLLRMEPT